MSNPLGVTHFAVFNQTESGSNLRIARVPRGPTLCFKIVNYSLIKDVLNAQVKPKSPGMEYRFAPLVFYFIFFLKKKEYII